MAPAFDQHRDHFAKLRDAALHAVDAAAAVERSFSIADFADAERVFVVGAGKAGVAMAKAAVSILGERLSAGIVSVPVLPPDTLHQISFIAGGHPTPNAGSLAAGQAMADLLAQTTARDLVLALISGGGSALLELPQPGLSLIDLQTTTNALLKCGATIHEINCIRSRLSRLKGGGLARLAYPACVLGLVLSDVVGNSLDVIASGPTVPLVSSEAEAKAVVEKYRLNALLPPKVLGFLKQKPPVEEVLCPTSWSVENRIIASNRLAGEAAAAAAKKLGFDSFFLADDWQGEAREVGKRFARLLIENAGQGPKCFIVGGETTVTIRGNGKGGRNQEAALAAAIVIAGQPNIAVAAFATDGIDGPTDAAGAIVTGDTISCSHKLGLDPQQHLDGNNSYPFLSGLGDLIVTGPTGTNVNDLLFGLTYY